MEFIKEYCPSKDHSDCIGIIRTTYYGSDLSFFLKLFEELKKDFPKLTPDKVRVTHYGGRHYAGTFGLEFNVPVKDVPKSYDKIANTEVTK